MRLSSAGDVVAPGRVERGPGWSRNGDRTDHPGADDLCPWASEYDSAAWVIADLRDAMAARLAGRSAGADEIVDWFTSQSRANFLAVAETYEEKAGRYKFNAPMVGFGAGAYLLAHAQRAEGDVAPACGAFRPEEKPTTPSRLDAGTAPPDAGRPMAERCFLPTTEIAAARREMELVGPWLGSSASLRCCGGAQRPRNETTGFDRRATAQVPGRSRAIVRASTNTPSRKA